MRIFKILLFFLFRSQSFVLIIICGISSYSAHAQKNKSNYLNFKNSEELYAFFRYEKDGDIIISGHRGGIDFPENSLEGLAGVLEIMPAFFEIDPRLTKDSIIVLLHDATLDRTTSASGKLVDYTLQDLKDVKLKDSKGNVTSYKIPTLEEVIIWSKGKTIINLDKKDVPLCMIADLIEKHNAEKNVMLTVHTGAQARYYYDRFPNIMLSVFARTAKELEDIEISGVPWRNMIAYVGKTINENNQEIIRKLRQNGVRCMISVASTHDKIEDEVERERLYKEEIEKKPDIIESDLPLAVCKVLNL